MNFETSSNIIYFTILLNFLEQCKLAIPYIIVLFVETPCKFITAVINLRGVSTNKTIIYFIAMQTYKELIAIPFAEHDLRPLRRYPLRNSLV
jgi:hypothetical protein